MSLSWLILSRVSFGRSFSWIIIELNILRRMRRSKVELSAIFKIIFLFFENKTFKWILMPSIASWNNNSSIKITPALRHIETAASIKDRCKTVLAFFLVILIASWVAWIFTTVTYLVQLLGEFCCILDTLMPLDLLGFLLRSKQVLIKWIQSSITWFRTILIININHLISIINQMYTATLCNFSFLVFILEFSAISKTALDVNCKLVCRNCLRCVVILLALVNVSGKSFI